MPTITRTQRSRRRRFCFSNWALATTGSVPMTGSPRKASISSTEFSDGDATQDIDPGLSDENTTFVAGELKQSDDQTSGITLTSSNYTELEFALREAGTSNRADTIRLIQGTYYGNFVYQSAEPNRLTIEGGYLEGCPHRESDRAKTVLDGGGKGTVLELSTLRVAPEYVLDGLTIQGGKPTKDKPGGIIIRSNGGEIIMKNCVVNGGIARGTGGVTVQDGAVKGGIRKKW